MQRIWVAQESPKSRGLCTLPDMMEKPVRLPLPLTPEAAALKPAPKSNVAAAPATAPAEAGGPKGPEPTRFGDWERKGRCSDF
jgi:hypothetical protein